MNASNDNVRTHVLRREQFANNKTFTLTQQNVGNNFIISVMHHIDSTRNKNINVKLYTVLLICVINCIFICNIHSPKISPSVDCVRLNVTYTLLIRDCTAILFMQDFLYKSEFYQ